MVNRTGSRAHAYATVTGGTVIQTHESQTSLAYKQADLQGMPLGLPQ